VDKSYSRQITFWGSGLRFNRKSHFKTGDEISISRTFFKIFFPHLLLQGGQTFWPRYVGSLSQWFYRAIAELSLYLKTTTDRPPFLLTKVAPFIPKHRETAMLGIM